MKKTALISVSDRTNLVDFARRLQRLGFNLLTTTGSGKFLAENGIVSESIEAYTGQLEILDGRVKTLHPKIHAGLLAKRDNQQHMKQLEQQGIDPISVVAVNLYPFIETAEKAGADDVERMVELIDIGGPTMIRAAAKNFKHIFAVIDPADYEHVIASLNNGELMSQESCALRRCLAVKVFSRLARYNLEIARYFAAAGDKAQGNFGPIGGEILQRAQSLRYGENPHQKAALYTPLASMQGRVWQQLHGKELSYNNLLDTDAALKFLWSVWDEEPTVAILKHLNPCGAARGKDLLAAVSRAKAGDPRSHFGGILVFNREVGLEVAEEVRKDFAEIVVAPSFAPAALEALRTSKNLRVIRVCGFQPAQYEMRSIEGGVLLQERDGGVSAVAQAELVTQRKPSEAELRDLQFAWMLCAHVKSNAIVLVNDGMLIGTGAGQMSRIDSVEVALSKAAAHGHVVKGAVAASDAFFPFADNIERLSQQGVVAAIAPRGAKRDDEIIAAAQKAGISLLFCADRHFRH